MNLRTLIGPLVFLFACGSAVDPTQGEGGSTGEASSSSTGTTVPGETGSSSSTTGSEPGTSSGAPEPGTGSSSTSTTTGDMVDTGEAETGCPFLCPDDDPPPWAECGVWEQDCPPGEKCAPWANDGGSAWNAWRCTPVAADPDGSGEPCTVEGGAVSGIDSCEVGAMCWDVDPDTEMGTCVPLCTGSEEAPVCADPTRSCSTSGAGILALCLAMCDPLDPQACGAGEGCYQTDSGFVCGPDASDKGGGPFEPCEFLNACDAGSTCVSPTQAQVCEGVGGSGCCAPYCDLAAPSCPPGSSCQPAFEDGDTPAGFETVGICGGVE